MDLGSRHFRWPRHYLRNFTPGSDSCPPSGLVRTYTLTPSSCTAFPPASFHHRHHSSPTSHASTSSVHPIFTLPPQTLPSAPASMPNRPCHYVGPGYAYHFHYVHLSSASPFHYLHSTPLTCPLFYFCPFAACSSTSRTRLPSLDTTCLSGVMLSYPEITSKVPGRAMDLNYDGSSGHQVPCVRTCMFACVCVCLCVFVFACGTEHA